MLIAQTVHSGTTPCCPNPRSENRTDSQVASGIGIFVVAAAVLAVVVWVVLRWLGRRTRRRSESDVATESR